MLWIIDYENAHFCGGELNVVVEAESENEAVEKASDHMEETQRELFASEYEDERGEDSEYDSEYDDESAVSINSVELFDENHEQWKFFKMPGQSEFYPVIN